MSGKITTSVRLSEFKFRAIDELAEELGLNRTQFFAWMLDVVIVNWEALKEAEAKRKGFWAVLQNIELKKDFEKYMKALRDYEAALKIT
ncbi:MAG: hypothetical protein HWN68_17485 [Desulfobacterales bacterium]|nr:hypothetical protein [Desulfobacterales bacterium]